MNSPRDSKVAPLQIVSPDTAPVASTALAEETEPKTAKHIGANYGSPLNTSEIEELEHKNVKEHGEHPSCTDGPVESARTSPAQELEPSMIPVSPGHPANLVREAHLYKHQHPYRANVDTNLLGLRTTSRPPAPLAFPKQGLQQNPISAVTPAAVGIAPPVSARPVKGIHRRNMRAAASGMISNLMPGSQRSVKSHHVAGKRGKSGNEMLPLTSSHEMSARIQQIFGKAGTDPSRTALVEKIKAALELPDSESIARPYATKLAFTHHALLAERLAQVVGGDADRALAALDALTEGRFLPFTTRAFEGGEIPARLEDLLTLPRERTSRAQPQLDALSTAALLASSPSGFETVLRALKPALPHERHAGFKRLLEAVAQIESEQRTQGDLALHTITARGALETNRASLAQEVLHIESLALGRPADSYATLNVHEKAALFAWNNGFRERGKGTALAKVQGRIAKLSKYAERASHLQALHNVSYQRHDKLRSSLKVIDAQLRILAMRAQQSVGRKKVPMSSLGKFGVDNNWLLHPEDDVAVLDTNARTAIRHLRQHYAQTVEDKKRFQGLLLDQRTKELPAPVLHSALLDYWETRIERGRLRPLGIKLDSASLSSIAEQIATRYGVQTAKSRIEEQLRNWAGRKPFRDGLKISYKIDRELTVQDLKTWAENIHVATSMLTPIGDAIAQGASAQEARERTARPLQTQASDSAGAPAAANTSPTHFEETQFGTALRKAMAVTDSSTIVPDDLSADGLHRFTRMYLQEHNWSNPVTATNGGTFGINTGSIASSIKELSEHLLPVSAVPVLDLKLSRSNNAVLSMGTTSHGSEIFLGTQRQTSGSFGIGMSVAIGPNALRKILGQATASAQLTPIAVESARTRGVMVRSMRTLNADGTAFDNNAARAEIIRFNDLMWSIVKGEHGPLSPEQVWEKIAEAFFESNTFSIGWQDQDSLNLHHSATLSGALRAGHSVDWLANQFRKNEVARATVGGSYTGDLTSIGTNRRREDTGRNRLLRANRQWRIMHTAALSTGVTNPPIPLSGTQGELAATLASGATQIAQTFQLSDHGFNATFRALLKSGKLSDPFTLREFEEREARAFVNFLKEPSRRGQYVQVFKAAFGENNGEREFEHFLQKAQNWAGPGQRYIARYRIHTEDRKALDELAATAHAIHERDPDDPLLRNIQNEMKARLENEDAWVPMQTLTLEGQAARETLGINLGIQFNAVDSVTADRELSRAAIPETISNDWASRQKDVPISNPAVQQGSARK